MIEKINVIKFREMFLGACQNLSIHEEEINALNVFPVPDGDTGTNMSATLCSAAKELETIPASDLTWTLFASALSKGSLRGARGNSGVILSQIFKGIADIVLTVDEDLSLEIFSKALLQGSQVAYSAVDQPKEGTILTVIRTVAEASESAVRGGIGDFISLLKVLNETGTAVLQETPEMLPVLKKAGVVDAGGMGLMKVFEAFAMVLEGRELPKQAVNITSEEKDAGFAADVHDLDDIEFAYCTEFFIKNLRPSVSQADIDKLRDRLSSLGNSLICIGDLQFVKVHVHTNDPGKALQYALELGELDRVKIENMLEQNRKIKAELEKSKKQIGMVAVCSGVGIRKMFKELLVDVIVEGGQTMNPSVNEIVSAINRVNADTVFILPNNKNIILAAQKAMDISDRKCVVLPTENVATGIAAAIAFDPHASVDENKEMMRAAFADLTCAQITKAVRNADMDGFSVEEGDVIGLSDKMIVAKGDNVLNVLSDVVRKMKMDSMDVLNLYSGEGVSDEENEKTVEKLNEEFPDLEVILYKGEQPHSIYILAAE